VLEIAVPEGSEQPSSHTQGGDIDGSSPSGCSLRPATQADATASEDIPGPTRPMRDPIRAGNQSSLSRVIGIDRMRRPVSLDTYEDFDDQYAGFLEVEPT
jgi:hypothetical protein